MGYYDISLVSRLLAYVALGCSGVVMTGQVPATRTLGITTSTPGQAAFDAAISKVTFSDPNDKSLLPFGVLIQNQGFYTVVAYALEWTFDSGNGTPLVTEQTTSEPFALNDGDKSGSGRFYGDAVLPPGRSRLVTPAFNYDLGPKASLKPLTSNAARVHQTLLEFSDYQKQQPFKEVRLAAYVLQDGTCVQITKSQLCIKLQAAVDAIQDVLQAAGKQVFDGNTDAYMSSVTTAAGIQAASGNHLDSTYDVIYTQVQGTWLRLLRRKMEQTGYDQTMIEVRKRLYQKRPSITSASSSTN